MIIPKNNIFNQIKEVINPNYKNKKNLLYEYLVSIENNNFFCNPLNHMTVINNSSSPAYYDNGIINIPLEPSGIFLKSYTEIEKIIKEATFEFMIFHEIGHAVQETNAVGRDFKQEPIDLGSKLSYLFNGSSKPHVMSILLKTNYQESYSDCYAAYCIYKKNKDSTIFDRIHKYRESSDQEMRAKNSNHLNQYSNLEAVLLFKNAIIDQPNLTYAQVHEKIEVSIVKSIKDFLIKELKTNDSLLLELKKYGKEFNKHDGFKGFWTEFKSRAAINPKFDVIDSQELNNILNAPIYQRTIASSTEHLHKTQFGLKHNLSMVSNNIQQIRISMKSNNEIKQLKMN